MKDYGKKCIYSASDKKPIKCCVEIVLPYRTDERAKKSEERVAQVAIRKKNETYI
jgi:hypothetical protein